MARRSSSGEPFEALDDGRVAVHLGDVEREVLTSLVPHIRTMLSGDDDPSLERLRPPAHAADPGVDAEYQQLMGNDLAASRERALDTMEASLTSDELDPAGVEAWMHTLNAVRLVLGTRLGIDDDRDPTDGPLAAPGQAPDDPEAEARFVYLWLSELLDALVNAAWGNPD